MTIRRLVFGIAILVLVTGCKSSFQSNWRNFNAYYNTYYNAKQSYQTGLQKNLNQPREYNPLQPIRIHPKPVNAGAQDFDKAIQKGADVLRRYEDTKWVDNAIGLIGKSYYFRQEYFSADQKFKELFITSSNPDMQQQSILWQGRVLLDMELHNEGVAFLSEQLTLQEEEWDKSHRAEVKALLAQHHVKLENWQVAANELSEALPDLPKKEYKERGYFLLGQIYEHLDNSEAAFEAYKRVEDYYVEYRIQYLAKRKQAEVARNLGREEVAFNIFNSMVRDDKNLEYKAELDFELAQTEHERGNYKRAEKLYNNVLHQSTRQPTPEIAARAYNGLAEIYRFGYDNFSKAAAYYDSAAQRNVPAERLPEDFQAAELSESFGNYARIKSQISLQDSLLTLGQLSPEAFDSVITQLKAKKAAELEKMREQKQQNQNQLITVDQDSDEQAATNLSNGFLNSNNPVIQQEVKQQFFAIWGDRPLADDWRARSNIDLSSVDDDTILEDGEGGAVSSTKAAAIQIDLSGIPFTPQEQDSVRKLIAAYEYELGNLFFLSLNLPDSAIHYFQNAIKNPSKANINSVSLYSLSELYSIQENEEQARVYAERLVNEYPKTEYARRVADKFGISLNQVEMNSVNPLMIYNTIKAQDSLNHAEKAARLNNFALTNSEHNIAPQAQYEAITNYMMAGKEEPQYQSKIGDWVSINEKWDKNIDEFKVKKDSARAALNDTTLSEEQRSKFQSLIDSTLTPPNFVEAFPYRGANWDSARAVADTFLVVFQNSKLRPKVTRIKNELALPAEEKEEIESEDELESSNEDEAATDGYLNCEYIEAQLEIRGGMQSFMRKIELPSEIGVLELSYLFRVNQRGVVDEYELRSEGASEELVSEFKAAIDESLSFEPVLNDGQAVSVECMVNFPLKN